MDVPKEVKNGFKSHLGSRCAGTARKTGADAKPKLFPNPQKRNQNSSAPIWEQACTLFFKILIYCSIFQDLRLRNHLRHGRWTVVHRGIYAKTIKYSH
jgi:hypothetical protein